MHKRSWLAYFRLSFGLLAITALIVQFIYGLNHPPFKVSNFFSFFTIQSNILAALVLTAGASQALLGTKRRLPDWIRGGAMVYMTLTGVVYALLLANLDSSLNTSLPWVNNVLHRIMPVVLLLDWLLDPPRQPTPFKKALLWISFPLVYVAYSLIRGLIVHWYPYPFLDPRQQGYARVAVICVSIATIFIAFVWLITRLSKLQTHPKKQKI